MLFFIVIFLSLITIYHYFCNFYFGTKKVDVNTILIMKEIIKKDELNILIDIKDESPYYDSEKRIIVMPDKKNVFGVTAGFHELGHVYDDMDKNLDDSYSTLSYYTLKYSIIPAIATVYGVSLYPYYWMMFLGVITSGVSLYFFWTVLSMELGATKHAKRLIDKYVEVNQKTKNHIHQCMYGALSTYVGLMIVSFGTLIANVYVSITGLL